MLNCIRNWWWEAMWNWWVVSTTRSSSPFAHFLAWQSPLVWDRTGPHLVWLDSFSTSTGHVSLLADTHLQQTGTNRYTVHTYIHTVYVYAHAYKSRHKHSNFGTAKLVQCTCTCSVAKVATMYCSVCAWWCTSIILSPETHDTHC